MRKLLTVITALGFAASLEAAFIKRPSCDDDFVPYGLEVNRVAYAIHCGYIPKKMQRYYGTTFDANQQKLVKQTQFNKYPIFAKKSGLQWDIWKPESRESDFPDSCSKPKDVEWVGSCVR